MSSNSGRVKAQYTALPVAFAIGATVFWPISYMAVSVVAPSVSSGPVDLWFGVLSTATFIGAAGLTIGFVITALDGVWNWFRQ